jgi:hypothetical protein
MSDLPDGFCDGARIVLSGTMFECQGARISAAKLREVLLQASATQVLVNPHPRDVSMIQHVLIFNQLNKSRPVIQAATAVSMPLVSWDAVGRHCRQFDHIATLARNHRVGAQPVSPISQESISSLSAPAGVASLLSKFEAASSCTYAPRF